MAGFDKGVDMPQVEFKGEGSMKSGCRFTENGIEIYDVSKDEWEPITSAYEWVNKRTRPAKPNNKTMKYRVKTDRMPFKKGTEFILDEDINGVEFNPYGSEYPAIGREMLQAYPNDFEPVEEIQKGDYVFRVWPSGTKTFGRVTDGGYGNESKFFLAIEPYEEEGGASAGGSYGWGDYEYEKATTDEIQQALVKEAKRRGLVDQKIKSIDIGEFKYRDHYRTYSTNDVSKCKVSNSSWYYNEERDYLASTGYGYPVIVYSKGEFAEIVDQTPDIEINGNKVEFNDHPKVGCTTIKKEVFIEQAKTITRHGVRVHRKGEDITDQILAIASHYGYEDEIKYRAGDTIIMGTLEDVTFSDQNMWGNDD